MLENNQKLTRRLDAFEFRPAMQERREEMQLGGSRGKTALQIETDWEGKEEWDIIRGGQGLDTSPLSASDFGRLHSSGRL